MEDETTGDSTANRMNFSWVLALPAPSLSRSERRQQPKEKKRHTNEKNDEGMLWNTLIVNQGQDIGEEVLTYFQEKTKSLENFNGHTWIGNILSATGLVLQPVLDRGNSAAASDDKDDPCKLASLSGTYVISEDGEVQQSGLLTISYGPPNCDAIGGLLIGPLIAAGEVQVRVCAFHKNPSEDEEMKDSKHI